TIAWVRGARLDGPIYSNVPDAIYLMTGKHARFTPWRAGRLERMAGVEGYLVWVDRKPMGSLFRPEELARVVRVRPLRRFDDGAVFVLGDREVTGEAMGDRLPARIRPEYLDERLALLEPAQHRPASPLVDQESDAVTERRLAVAEQWDERQRKRAGEQ